MRNDSRRYQGQKVMYDMLAGGKGFRNHMKNVVLDHGRIGWTDFEGTLIVLLRFLTVEKNIKEEQELIARRKDKGMERMAERIFHTIPMKEGTGF